MPTDQLLTIIYTAIVTGGVSAIATVGALKVHINYLREGQERNERAIARAHKRIDELGEKDTPG